ncbi:MAG: methyltransferase domain-containing protein [Armatimonadetes bacterium]|nr:methyltransferase domain-containing protein [Armatimonadota bacterium]
MRHRLTAEWMDDPEVDAYLLADDLRTLAALNALLGGVRAALQPLLRRVNRLPPGMPVRVADVATGGGDIARRLVDACRRRGRPVRVVALDRHPKALAYARSVARNYPEIAFVQADARDLPLADGDVDFALLSQALHHLPESDALQALRELKRVARRGVAVADLRRHPLAYLWIRLLTTVWFRNPLARHDGPASIRNAFERGELGELAARAGLEGATVQCFPFYRLALVYEAVGASECAHV